MMRQDKNKIGVAIGIRTLKLLTLLAPSTVLVLPTPLTEVGVGVEVGVEVGAGARLEVE